MKIFSYRLGYKAEFFFSPEIYMHPFINFLCLKTIL